MLWMAKSRYVLHKLERTTFQAIENLYVICGGFSSFQTYLAPGKSKTNEEYMLDDLGFAFARKCIEIVEVRGLEEEGLYRIGGVNTKINKLMMLGMDRNKTDKERLQFFHEEQYSDLLETKTIASALKHYLRNLNEPLMTFRYHNGFIAAASKYRRGFGNVFCVLLLLFC